MKNTALICIVSALALPTVNAQITVPDELDDALRQLITQNQFTGEPDKNMNIPSSQDPEVVLGKLLFFSKSLSGDKDVACASCHHPYLGGGDALSLPVGTEAVDPDVIGPGREIAGGVLNVPRNSPTVFNSWSYNKAVFWDSRVALVDPNDPTKGITTPDVPLGEADPNAGDNLIAAQALFPVAVPEEMQGHTFKAGASNQAVREHLAARIGDYGDGQGELFKNEWRSYFEAVYGESTPADEEVVTYANIASAIGAYQRSMNFSNNRWFDYVKGDVDALSESEKRGAFIFLDSPPLGPPPGGPGDTPPPDGPVTPPPVTETASFCTACHTSDTFNSVNPPLEHRVAFPQIGPGKGHGNTGTGDEGRGGLTGSVIDQFSFRNPTLLNIEVTGPYGHTGSFQTLEEVIDHYDDFHASLTNYVQDKQWCELTQFRDRNDCENLFPDVEANSAGAAEILKRDHQNGIPLLRPLGLTVQQKADLVAFLKTLTDPCVKDAACLQQWLPQESEGNPDGLLLKAKKANGVPLYLAANCAEGDTIESGDKLKLDQQACLSGSNHYLSVDVPRDNSTLFISTTGGKGNLQLFYHDKIWATPQNSLRHTGDSGTEQVMKVTVNSGTHYITVNQPAGYQQVGIAASIEAADTFSGEKPDDIANACSNGSATPYAELVSGRSLCAAPGTSYFYVNVTDLDKDIVIKTQHGQGDVRILAARGYWPNAYLYDFSAGKGGSSQYLRLNPTETGWLFVTVVSDEQGAGVSVQRD